MFYCDDRRIISSRIRKQNNIFCKKCFLNIKQLLSFENFCDLILADERKLPKIGSFQNIFVLCDSSTRNEKGQLQSIFAVLILRTCFRLLTGPCRNLFSKTCHANIYDLQILRHFCDINFLQF